MTMYWRYLIFVTGIILVNACTVGPDFVKPTPVLSDHYTAKPFNKNLGRQHLKSDKVLSVTWWTEFHSSALNEVMQQGIKHNYSLIAMQETLAEAHELLIAAKGQLWPEATMTAAVGRQKYGVALFGPLTFHIPPFTYYEIGPSVNYSLDAFGGTRRTIEKQRAMTLYQQQELHAAFLTVTGNIVTTSLTIAALNAQLSTIKTIIYDDKKNLQLVQKAFRLGSVTRTEILIAQSQLANDETLLPPLYQQLKVAEGTLSVLLGIAPEKVQFSRFKMRDFTLPKELPLILPSELIHKRPDILAAESMLHAACADVGIATAHLFPNITLSATTLQEALTPGALFNSSANAWSLLGNVTAPIFNGGQLRAQRRASIHAYQSAFAKYQEIVLKAFAQVREVLYALKHDEQEVLLQNKAVLIAKDSLSLVRRAFDAGSVGILELLDSERLYAQARLGYIKAQAQWYQDTIQLYLVLGGSVEPTAFR